MDKKDNIIVNQQERLDAYRKALDEAFRVASDSSIDQRRERMLERLDARIEADQEKNRRRRRVLGSALAVACLSVAAVFIWHKQPSEMQQAVVAFENTQDVVKCVSLPDGTSVCLHHGASLQFTETGGMRLAQLSGEAYFDVAKDSLRPFVVKTDALDVRVLGTAFCVSAPPGYSKTDVILERGSVTLQSKGGASMLRLAPNQKAVYDASTGYVAVEQVLAKNLIQQEFGMVSFENARIPEIISAIEDQFGIKVSASGYNPDKQYNVSYFSSDSPGDILAMLEVLTGGHFSSCNSF